MARGIVEEKQTLREASSALLKDVDGMVHLREKLDCRKIPIAIFPRLEDDARVPMDRKQKEKIWRLSTYSVLSSSLARRRPHSDVKKSETMIDWPSPFG